MFYKLKKKSSIIICLMLYVPNNIAILSISVLLREASSNAEWNSRKLFAYFNHTRASLDD